MPPTTIDIRSAEDSRDVIHRAVQTLAEGGLVAFPTETVYGLGASAVNEAAVRRLIELKKRAGEHPFTLAVKSADDALDFVPEMPALGQRLARRCWPGPVTLVLDSSHPDSLLGRLPDSARQAVSPNGTLGLRVPAHPTVLDVMRLLAGPLALTSANRPGEPDATSAAEVLENLGDDVQLVLDDGPSRFGQPSSVVRITADCYEILRAGVVTEQTLKRLASMMVLVVCTGNTCRSPMAELLLRSALAEKVGCPVEELEDHGVVVASAGIAAAQGGRPSQEAVEVMREMGLDLSGHESQPLNEKLVQHADLILTMTRSHREALLAQWPGAAERTRLLCRNGSDVADPIGGPTELYRRCAEQIKDALSGWVDELKP